MHSVPALVDIAYWKGAVHRSTTLLSCCAIVRETNRLTMSPTTIPRTPPRGFWRAVNLPILIIALILGGVKAWHNFSPTRNKR